MKPFILSNWRKKRAIKRIKNHMLFFGYDISDMTDEEIEAGVVRLASVVSMAGVTTEQAACGLRKVISAMENK